MRMGFWTMTRTWRLTVLWTLVALNAGGILLAGLNAQGFGFHNDVEWATEGAGIEFGRYGLAYTDTFTTQEGRDEHVGLGFTIEIALRPGETAEPGFQFIAVVHSGEDDSQLVIAKWRQSLIVMNGDDYDYRRRLPRLTAAISELEPGPFFLVVRLDTHGSALYVDGKQVSSRAGVTFRLPTDSSPGRLVLGNSVYGDSPWHGRISGFALHPVALDDEALQHHLELWHHDQGFTGSDYASANLSYPFSKRTDRKALDRSSTGIDLQFPRERSFVDPKLFTTDINAFALRELMTWDTVVNLCGFIPLGFLLLALLAEVTRMTQRHALAIAITVGFVLSLCIEVAQAWMPPRSSSFLDLLLNVVGTAVGAGTFAALASRSKGRGGSRSRYAVGG